MPSLHKTDDNVLQIAKNSLDQAIYSLAQAKEKLNSHFQKAVDLILKHDGKIVVCGIGKSGYAAKKTAASFCSVGVPAVFLNPNEALHGDLGLYKPKDPTIIFSNSGSTAEITKLVPIMKQFKSPLICIVGNPQSLLAKQADCFIDASVDREGDPLGIVPSTSVLVSLGLADALVGAVMMKRSFKKEDFLRFHPAGQLGKNLLYTVRDVMHPSSKLARIGPQASLKEAIIALSYYNLGAVCIINEQTYMLEGIITDGDIRRALLKYDNTDHLSAVSIMTSNPKVIDPDCLLGQALDLMENRPNNSQLSILPVVETTSGKLLGLIRLHDIYSPHY